MREIVKDAGDDPDVTHGALVVATGALRAERRRPELSGRRRRLGLVTRPGLPLPPGEPAINPAPRAMIRANLEEVAGRLAVGVDAQRRDFDPRRGKDRRAHCQRQARHSRGPVDPRHDRGRGALFLRGLDPLDPSRGGRRTCERMRACRGGDGRNVRGAPSARFMGCPTMRWSRWAISPAASSNICALRPVERVTIAGGPAKMTKLAAGLLDLHSKRGAVDLAALGARVSAAGGTLLGSPRRSAAPTAGLHAFELGGGGRLRPACPRRQRGMDGPPPASSQARRSGTRDRCGGARRARAGEQRISAGLEGQALAGRSAFHRCRSAPARDVVFPGKAGGFRIGAARSGGRVADAAPRIWSRPRRLVSARGSSARASYLPSLDCECRRGWLPHRARPC